MDSGSARQQIVESIKSNSNILVTVSTNPTVDELSAALGLTILLNNLDKRATAVVSGAIPPAITFLDPNKTFESTVDSLRDFIIALDKEKADHLRYKVDGDVVKIFITPYRTTLSEKDLDFSQGDYNVELVLALGVKDQDHLDAALAAHGRILHDATVATISAGADPSSLGSIDWRDAAASSLCEMLVSLTEALKEDKPVLDEQIATAFLTGIVSATDRFSNERTSSRVMTMAAQLMAAGANQQLIAAKLQEAHDIGPDSHHRNSSGSSDASGASSDGTVNLSEGKSTKLNKDHKKGDKRKKNDNGLQIDRNVTDKVTSVVATDQVIGTEEQKPAEAEVVTEAVEAAESAQYAEQQLDAQLSQMTEPTPAPSLADIQNELAGLAPAQEPAPVIADEPLPPQPVAEPMPVEAPAPAASDADMPGFEAIEVPPAPAPVETTSAEPEVSPFISSMHNATDYVGANETPTFASPLNGTVSDQQHGAMSKAATIDPFSVPLPTLNDTPQQPESPVQEAIENTFPQSPVVPEVVNTVSDEVIAPPEIVDLPSASVQAPAPVELPPLPPLPDFSSLPPLPPPPVPPASGQFGPLPPQAPTDQPGDIFGTPPPPEPPKPTTPPEPGQFRIPGQ